jgi:hypothetical protein
MPFWENGDGELNLGEWGESMEWKLGECGESARIGLLGECVSTLHDDSREGNSFKCMANLIKVFKSLF